MYFNPNVSHILYPYSYCIPAHRENQRLKINVKCTNKTATSTTTAVAFTVIINHSLLITILYIQCLCVKPIQMFIYINKYSTVSIYTEIK